MDSLLILMTLLVIVNIIGFSLIVVGLALLERHLLQLLKRIEELLKPQREE